MDDLIKNHPIASVAVGVAAAAGLIGIGAEILKPEVPLEQLETIEWVRPTTDAEWAEDVKEESLNVKRTDQLEHMLSSLEEKMVKMQDEAEEYEECPECIKFDYGKTIESKGDEEIVVPDALDTGKGKFVEASDLSAEEKTRAIDYNFSREKDHKQLEIDRTQRSIERLQNELRLRKSGYLEVLTKTPGDPRFDPYTKEYEEVNAPGSRVRAPLGTAYYIDFNAAGGGTGTATTSPFNSLDAFTEVARSAGDIAFVRRGTASTTNVSTLDHTSDGSRPSPIVVSADYDNLWSDFATSSQTYTPVFGSKDMTANTTITGIAAGDWIYVEGDCYETYSATSLNPCMRAYEVANVSGTTLSLYIPYEGNQSGSGKALRVMPDNPIWNTTAGNFSLTTNTDHHWVYKGLHIRCSTTCIVNDSSINAYYLDMIFEGDGSTTILSNQDDNFYVEIEKSRFKGANIASMSADVFGQLTLKDIFYDGDAAQSGNSNFNQSGWVDLLYYDVEYTDLAAANNFSITNGYLFCRNCDNATTYNDSSGANVSNLYASVQDYGGTVGDSRYTFGIGSGSYLADVDAENPMRVSTTTNLRSGGGPENIFVRPSAALGANASFSRMLLFEYPIYSDAASHTYNVYAMSTSTSNWTNDPTKYELWIECEYLSDASTAWRSTKRSTGTLDFNGSTAWNSLSVSCAPAQAGVVYLRAWYAKTKEGASNYFFVDAKPEII